MSWFRAKDFETVDMTPKILGPPKDRVEKQQKFVFQSILFSKSRVSPRLLEPDPTKPRCKLCFTTLSNPESIENQTCRSCSKSISSSIHVRPINQNQTMRTTVRPIPGSTTNKKETQEVVKINYVCKAIYKTAEGKSRCPVCKLTGTASGRKTSLCSFCTKKFNKRKMFCHHCKATMVNVEKFHLCGLCLVPYCTECSELIKMKKFVQECDGDSDKNGDGIKVSKCCNSGPELIEFNKQVNDF